MSDFKKWIVVIRQQIGSDQKIAQILEVKDTAVYNRVIYQLIVDGEEYYATTQFFDISSDQ